MKILKVGTRPSQLAQTQTNLLIRELREKNPSLLFESVIIKTSGDNKQQLGSEVQRDKKDWIQELELAILERKIDFAIHSAKDVPYSLEAGTSICSALKREDCRDVFIGKTSEQGKRIKFLDLPTNAKIGTSSLRRAAQIKNLKPDLIIKELRGNVPTRIQKLDNSQTELDGIILAAAGLSRLGYKLSEFEALDPKDLLPSATQGILCAQYMSERTEISEILSSLKHEETELNFLAERSVIKGLQADCSSAVAVYSSIENNEIKIIARVFALDGSSYLEESVTGPKTQAISLGEQLTLNLLEKGAKQLMFPS